MTNQLANSNASDGSVLLDQVRTALLKYVVFPNPEAPVAVTLWIAATHAMPAWNAAARFVIKGPQKQCGKTRLLDCTEAMSYKPLAAAHASAASVYRSISESENDPPTILIDEVDTIFGPKAGDNEALRGVLNAGHQRGKPMRRWDAKARTVEQLETFAMAALAGIGQMPETIEDRAVIITMKRRAAYEKVSPYRMHRDQPPLEAIGRDLTKWARANITELKKAVPVMPFDDRAADTWEPLIAIADLAGGDWPKNGRTAALNLIADSKQQDDNNEIRLLKDCQTIFTNGVEFLPTGTLLAKLNSDLEAPWATYAHGGLNPRQLAIILAPFGVRSTKKSTPKGRMRGYRKHDFQDAWNRYLPGTPVDPAHPAHPATLAQTEAQTRAGSPQKPEPDPDNPAHQPICLHCAQPHTPGKPHQCAS